MEEKEEHKEEKEKERKKEWGVEDGLGTLCHEEKDQLKEEKEEEHGWCGFLSPVHAISVTQLTVLAISPTPHLRLQGGEGLLCLRNDDLQRA